MQSVESEPKQPVFNVPMIILLLGLAILLVHAISVFWMTTEQRGELLLAFSFLSARYENAELANLWPGATYWTPFSYALLHADWVHVAVNLAWLLAFGAVVARRIGAIRFLVFFFLGAGAGALLHFFSYPDGLIPMVGASGSVSACMGAAARFAFPAGGRFTADAANNPRLSLIETFSHPQVLIFVGIWFAVNFLFGSGVIDLTGDGQSIAWQAHVGGFLFGLLSFSAFDPAIIGNKSPFGENSG